MRILGTAPPNKDYGRQIVTIWPPSGALFPVAGISIVRGTTSPDGLDVDQGAGGVP